MERDAVKVFRSLNWRAGSEISYVRSSICDHAWLRWDVIPTLGEGKSPRGFARELSCPCTPPARWRRREHR